MILLFSKNLKDYKKVLYGIIALISTLILIILILIVVGFSKNWFTNETEKHETVTVKENKTEKNYIKPENTNENKPKNTNTNNPEQIKPTKTPEQPKPATKDVEELPHKNPNTDDKYIEYTVTTKDLYIKLIKRRMNMLGIAEYDENMETEIENTLRGYNKTTKFYKTFGTEDDEEIAEFSLIPGEIFIAKNGDFSIDRDKSLIYVHSDGSTCRVICKDGDDEYFIRVAQGKLKTNKAIARKNVKISVENDVYRVKFCKCFVNQNGFITVVKNDKGVKTSKPLRFY